MNSRNYHKRIITTTIVLILGLVVAPGITQVSAINTSQNTSANLEWTQEFSVPVITADDNYVKATIEETQTFTTDGGRPMVPVVTKTFEFPRGTKITGISVIPSEIQTLQVEKRLRPVPSLEQIGKTIVTVEDQIDAEIYDSDISYPQNWYYSTKGAGLNSDGERVLFVSIHMYPVHYIPAKDMLEYVDEMRISIDYKEPETTTDPLITTYDLVIITPSEFSDYLQPLVSHKNNHGMETNLILLEDIYSNFSGRDKAEQIKWFLTYALDTWNIKYALLVGDINKLPIRSVKSYPWSGSHWGDYILSDLYYADIYDENFSFCSWDANNNSIFGEVEYESGFQIQGNNTDNVDLYPDIGVGRIPCSTTDEIQTAVDKIINYENYAYDQLWFKRIILAGGDTFPLSKMSAPFVYEGEITNEKVAQQLPDFTQIYLWSSKHNLHAWTFNRAINNGAGFVTYAGHGFEHGWGTYRPNAIRSRMGILQPLYYTPFVKFLKNGDKLPIIFFDACLTAKLDFNISDMENYYPGFTKLFLLLTRMPYDTSYYLPCFAWSFLKHEGGGSVATIGATRPAYTRVDADGVYGGAGYLDVQFFKAYEEGVTLSQMFMQAQNEYINNVGMDFFTMEEYLILGDPSLMVGGYP